MPLTAVIGTGTWGTAVAVLAVRAHGIPVVILGRDPAKIRDLIATRRHPLLPAQVLPEDLQITVNSDVLSQADLVLWAVPTQFTREQARRLSTKFAPRAVVVSLSKGLEQQSLKRMTEVLEDELGSERSYGCISGPSHAIEVLEGLPFGMVVAGPEPLRQLVVDRLLSPRCRLYTSSDLIGVEIGGALKNIIAIAAGICDGLGLGDNAKAAIMTRGLAEMRRLGRAMGACDATFAGMAGIGDLLTTCYSPHGRNRALGAALAKGVNAQEFLARSLTVAEGAWTCRAAVELGIRHGSELPIASQVANAIWAATPVTQAMENLLSRAPKEEDA
jgi:glycerol-3-phosphate dehydrogenase (NAD(P)+)